MRIEREPAGRKYVSDRFKQIDGEGDGADLRRGNSMGRGKREGRSWLCEA